MRIKIIGENNCARATRHLLRQAGFAVTEFLPSEVITQAPHSGYAITIDSASAADTAPADKLAPAPHTPDPTSKPDHSTHGQPASGIGEAPPATGGASPPTALCDAPGQTAQQGSSPAGFIHFDSVDSPLEAAILRHVTQLALTAVVVDRPGGTVHSERELRIVIPCSGNAQADEAAAVAVEFGVLRGLLDLTSPPAPAVADDKANAGASGGRKKWWMFGIALLTGSLLALTGSLQASPRRVVEGRGADGAFLHLEAALAPAQGQFGTGQTNLALIGGAPVSSSLYDSGNTALKVNCVVGCSATSGFSDNAAFAAGSTAVNNISAVFNDSITALTSGNAGALRSTSDRMLFVNLGKVGGTAVSGANVVDSGNTAFRVNCVVGCSASAGFSDNSAFTAGTTSETNVGGVFNDGLSTLSSGNAAAARITASRALHVNLRNASGAEIGTASYPVRTDPTGTTTQPVSGTFWQTTQPVSLASVPSHDVTNAGTFAVQVTSAPTTAVTGTFWQATQPVSIASMPSTPVTGTFWQATQPVSGTVTATQATGTNLHMVCDSGCTPGGSFADNDAFTAGSTAVNIAGGWYSSSPTACTDGSACAPSLTSDRKLFTQAFQGTSPWVVSNGGTFAVQAAQSGTWNVANTGTFATQATLQTSTGTDIGNVGLKSAQTLATVTNLAQLGGQAVSMGTGVRDAGTQRVTIATDDSVPVTGTFWQATQPVSGTVTADAGTGTFTVGQATGSNLHTVIDSGTTTVTQATGSNLHVVVDTAPSTAVTNAGTFAVQSASTLAAETTKVIGTVRNLGNAGAAFDAATGAAPPANAVLAGGIGSGATGGFTTGIPVCDSYYNINISSATTTLAVTGVSGRHVRICALNMVAAAADNVGIISGTGATCGTGTGAIVGTSAATGYNFAANGGIAMGSGIGTIMKTAATGDSVCIITSAATQLSGGISYTIY